MQMNRKQVSVLGAGTMGAGIAQIAAQHGWKVVLGDRTPEVAAAGREGVARQLARLADRQRITHDDANAALARITIAERPGDHADSALVIEAIIEDMRVKTAVLGDLLPHLNPAAVIATNTSALSVTEIGRAIGAAERTIGMHFFNPAPVMKLVEIVVTDACDPQNAEFAAETAASWGKTVARTADAPGFIVNHVARPYYLEAFRIMEDGHADPARIDRVMKEFGGFRMGPLELTDLIGQDVNTATTRSVYEGLEHPPLLAPSALQESLVARGDLGRKSGRGVFDHTGDAPSATPAPALSIRERDVPCSSAEERILRDFAGSAVDPAAAGTLESAAPADLLLFARILCGLIIQAHAARDRGIAGEAAIDTAMRAGVNYPRGPFEWAHAIGRERLNRTTQLLAERSDIRGARERFARGVSMSARV